VLKKVFVEWRECFSRTLAERFIDFAILENLRVPEVISVLHRPKIMGAKICDLLIV
jgi:hypothetical protein